MTTFYLIRHAERHGDPQRLVGRLPGVSLTAAGREQADRIARALAREPIARVFCSPQARARQTAEPLARWRSVALEISPAVDEIDFGAWTGQTFGELAADERWVRFNQDRAKAVAPGGESLAAVQARFVGALRRWRETYPDHALAVVSHADPIKLALAHFSGVPLALFDRIEIGLGSVSVLAVGPGDARVLRCNDEPAMLVA